jgi:hypothetical protein
VVYTLPATRDQFWLQLLTWGANIVISLYVAAASDDSVVTAVLMICMVLLEVFAFVHSTTELNSVVKFNIEHLNSRTGSFIMLMCGESVIQLLTPEVDEYERPSLASANPNLAAEIMCDRANVARGRDHVRPSKCSARPRSCATEQM